MRKEKDIKQWGCLKTIFLFVLGILVILLGGLSLASWLDTEAKKRVDKNGIYVNATVVRKNSNSKGRTTWFRFSYKGKEFVSGEAGRKLYDNLSIGDSVVLKIDTTDPTNTYAIFNEP